MTNNNPAVVTNQSQKSKFELEADEDDYNDNDFEKDAAALRESQPERNFDHIKRAKKLTQNETSDDQPLPKTTTTKVEPPKKEPEVKKTLPPPPPPREEPPDEIVDNYDDMNF